MSICHTANRREYEDRVSTIMAVAVGGGEAEEEEKEEEEKEEEVVVAMVGITEGRDGRARLGYRLSFSAPVGVSSIRAVMRIKDTTQKNMGVDIILRKLESSPSQCHHHI